MTFLELAQKRFSVRSYKPDPLDEELLREVLEAGRIAPSACNFQPWHFVVCVGSSQVMGLKKAYDREWFLSAPAVIVVCVDRTVCWKRKDGKDFGDVDAAIAMDHIVLAATEAGWGTCWIGAFDADEARKALKLPANIDPVVMTPIGYPAVVPPAARQRKNLGEVAHWGTFA